MKRIILTTNDLNRNGYRILTEGIDMTAFMSNPVMYYDHNTYRLPIGKWTDIQVKENGIMSAVPIFDEKDDDAMKVKQKYEDGFLNCASIHVRPLAYSSAIGDLLDGQRFETITKSEMLEVSIAGIPGNANAVKLSSNDSDSNPLPKPLSKNKNNLTMSLEKIAQKLKLSSNAGEDEIINAIDAIQNKEVSRMLALGEAKGVVTEKNKDAMQKLAIADPDSFGVMLNLSIDTGVAQNAQPAQSAKTVIAEIMRSNNVKQNVDDTSREHWKLEEWQQNDVAGLIEMRKNDPAKYESLAQSYYSRKKGFGA